MIMWIFQMSNKKPFPTPEVETEILQCSCGSVTFYQQINNGNHLECALCGLTATNDLCTSMMFDVTRRDDSIPMKRRIDDTAPNIGFERWVRSLDQSKHKILVSVDRDGWVNTYTTDVETEEQKAWAADQLDEAKSLIC